MYEQPLMIVRDLNPNSLDCNKSTRGTVIFICAFNIVFSDLLIDLQSKKTSVTATYHIVTNTFYKLMSLVTSTRLILEIIFQYFHGSYYNYTT